MSVEGKIRQAKCGETYPVILCNSLEPQKPESTV